MFINKFFYTLYYVPDIFQDIGLAPVHLIMHSADQLGMYSKLSNAGNLILHVDATAGLIKKAEYVKRQMYLLSAVVDSVHDEVDALSVSDCLTEECRVENVEFWLRKLRCDVARLQGSRFDGVESSPSVVVVDFSWVLIHACVAVFCGTTVSQYLSTLFNISMGRSTADCQLDCRLFACASHFISRAAKSLSRFFRKEEREGRQLMLQCVAALISASSLAAASDLWKLMVQVFSHNRHSAGWNTGFQQLLERLQGIPTPTNIAVEEGDLECDEVVSNELLQDHSAKTLRTSSPYSNFFVDPAVTSEDCTDDGPFFKPAALTHIFKVWLPLYGFWGQPSLREVHGVAQYLTNAKVESWFG